MDRRDLVPVLVTIIGLGTFGAGSSPVNAQQGFTHPGRVVEMGANRPATVDVKAWPESSQTGTAGDCPLYGKVPLDSARSGQSDGQFRLRIDRAAPTYTTTYCASGYYPRADRDHSNKVDGSSVVPNPVEMYSRKNDQTAYNLVVRSKIAALLNDLSYLQSIDPEGFKKAVVAFAADTGTTVPGRQKAVFEVPQLIHNWRQ